MSYKNIPIPKILVIDFDGTIYHEDHSIFPQIGPLFPGAREFINRLYSEGYYILINTCRHGEAELLCKVKLFEDKISYHSVNQHAPHLILKYGNDTRKMAGSIYIDNKNMGGLPMTTTDHPFFKDKLIPSWSAIYNQIHNDIG
jgi:hypothetical protein